MKRHTRIATTAFMLTFATFFIALSAVSSCASERMTPLLLGVHDAPVPFTGSDGRTRLVYELWMTNFSSGNLVLEQVDVLGDGAILQSLNGASLESRLQPVGLRQSGLGQPKNVIPPSTLALLFIHVVLVEGQAIPKRLTHRIRVRAQAAPPGREEITATGGETSVDSQPVIVLGPPLRGEHYISADSCCDASRHTRAALPVDGRVWLAQRYAVDWEQLDDEGRIYHGLASDVNSYNIYGKEVLAVADATVTSAIDGLPNQPPGRMPEAIPIEEVDGNSIVLDLGGERYGLYAHLQLHSLRVHTGDKVKRGQVIALVGNSGNTLAPHLHFHVMNSPSPLASNGLPYEIDNFRVTGISPSTAAFDTAEANGSPLAITPISPPQRVTNAMPLDQLIISFSP
jgi:murein DD-endopeptidase MepM/ murein hydrolase activator NlpD